MQSVTHSCTFTSWDAAVLSLTYTVLRTLSQRPVPSLVVPRHKWVLQHVRSRARLTEVMMTEPNDDSGRVEPRSDGDPGSVALAEVLAENAVVHIDDDLRYMVVTPKVGDGTAGYNALVEVYNDDQRSIALRDPGINRGVATKEMGYTSPSPFTSWT